MSSLAATQADGYYVPPEYFDSGQYKHKSKNQFAESKGHNQFVQRGIVRFELPYPGICQGPKCSKKLIGRGTRFNAKKVDSGEHYFTTPIWEFQLACRNCQHPWRIRTNPQERAFDYVEGITIRAGLVEQQPDNSTSLSSTTDSLQHQSQALDRLESTARGKQKMLTELETLQQLQQLNAQTTFLDSTLNATIRASFRKDRKEKRLRMQSAKQLGWREGMEVLSADTTTTTNMNEVIAAKSNVFGPNPSYRESKLFSKVRQSSIFEPKYQSTRKRKRPEYISNATTSVAPDKYTSSANLTLGNNHPQQVRILPSSDQDKPSECDDERGKSTLAPRTKYKIQLGDISQTHNNATTASEKDEQSHTPLVSNSLNTLLATYGSSDDDTDSEQ